MNNQEAGNALRWEKFQVGSGGNICLVDWMGDDNCIVEAARISYGEGTQHTSSARSLIRYLMRHAHTGPFEMAELKFRVRVPMDTWRQWIRHRTASVNEYSTRYSVAVDECAITMPGEWRLQSEDSKQGSSGNLNPTYGDKLTAREREGHALNRKIYEERLDWGIAREQARKDLPLSNYTEAVWKIDLHNLFHFLKLRMNEHAQIEIRKYANIIGEEVVAKLFPLAWEAFTDYRLKAVQLSRLDIGVLQRMVELLQTDPAGDARVHFERAQDPSWSELEKCRERDECWTKLCALFGYRPI